MRNKAKEKFLLQLNYERIRSHFRTHAMHIISWMVARSLQSHSTFSFSLLLRHRFRRHSPAIVLCTKHKRHCWSRRRQSYSVWQFERRVEMRAPRKRHEAIIKTRKIATENLILIQKIAVKCLSPFFSFPFCTHFHLNWCWRDATSVSASFESKSTSKTCRENKIFFFSSRRAHSMNSAEQRGTVTRLEWDWKCVNDK